MMEAKDDFESAIFDIPETKPDPYAEAGRALFEAAQETYGRNFVDPSKIDKILDKAGDACQVRNVARAASQIYDPAAGPLRFSFEVNKARNEETLVIDKVGRSHNFNIHKYTQSPICSD